MARDRCPATLRFWDVVSGLAPSLHPLLCFDQSPRLDAEGARNASARKPTRDLVKTRTWCLACSITQPWPPQRFRTCPHTKSLPTLLSGVSGPELEAKKTRSLSVVRGAGRRKGREDWDEPSLRREDRSVRCIVVRRGMLTGRKSVGRRVTPSVCTGWRIVRIVRRVASSRGLWFLLGRKSGKRLGLAGCACPKKEGVTFAPNAENH